MSKRNSAFGPVMNRRQALFLSATAGMGVALGKQAIAMDNTKTAAHQEPGNCSTPRTAVANTQYGKVRGFVDGGVFTFKGVPYGANTGGENRWLPAKPRRRGRTSSRHWFTVPTARSTCMTGRQSSRRSCRIGTTAT